MKVLVTGAAGFIGKNLVERLKGSGCPEVSEVFEFTRDSDMHMLERYCAESDFVFHLAGVNRPSDPAEFMEGNADLTTHLLSTLRQSNVCPVVLASSTQAAFDNPYGQSKKIAEDIVIGYAQDTGASAFIYRLPGVFGKWCRPNYNSVVATFCYNTARGIPVRIDHPTTRLALVYIDDVVDEFVRALRGEATQIEGGLYAVPVVHEAILGDTAGLLDEFKESREKLTVPDMGDAFTKKLYATYLSYLPTDAFSYPLEMRSDERGSFTEIIRTPDRGQFSVNISRPGIVKGNHWHNTKNEKFVVVDGEGVIRFRKVGEDAVIEYFVSGEKIEVVDIPPGYTHNIENLGDTDMVTFMWSNECFDPDNPDTFWLEV
ncbi:MAG: NAD-dependent epimerase/dehydratase family protein [Actinomycetota bacterium]|nr:MAG: NAD-dependent [Actinomycetota bacterium]MDO8949064.1 NAD-dependent epimerase/dehydratase family protein [Actinomycetota bacterium]MDP3630593.1 NAD-dependent epimerase/dehydratase family protein [Actinomycetota bacterium]